MRFEIKFRLSGKKQVLPFNYQYPLSSWIYRVLDQADSDFAAFLHEQGYRLENLKTFKLFTFSNLRFPRHTYKAIPKSDRMELWARNAWLTVAFQLPQPAGKFIVGLFQRQTALIGDRISQIEMEVESIEALKTDLPDKKSLKIKCLSPVVVAFNEEGKKYETYISPEHLQYKALFLKNLLDKYQAVCLQKGINYKEIQTNELDFKCLTKEPKSRKQTIKAHTAAETEVRGFLFNFELTAPKELIEIGLNSGFGSMNALGFGFCEVVY
jgi:CRISPR-associated endoribonuclease Cas6